MLVYLLVSGTSSLPLSKASAAGRVAPRCSTLFWPEDLRGVREPEVIALFAPVFPERVFFDQFLELIRDGQAPSLVAVRRQLREPYH